MPHQDQGRSPEAPAIAAALDWLVAPQMFGRLSFRKDCWWTPSSLVRTVLLWAWGEEAALTDRYVAARQIIARLADGQHESSVSYQAFVKLLRRHCEWRPKRAAPGRASGRLNCAAHSRAA